MLSRVVSMCLCFVFSSRRRHTRCALVTGVQTCALPIYELAWVVSATLLTSTASTPLWGKLSDLYGRRPLFQAAIVVFLIGSVLAGLSQSMGQLIAFRAIQGLGVGGLMALSQAIIGDIVSPRQRGRYQEIGRAHV